MRKEDGPTVITLSLNAPDDTKRTLESVSLQTTPPFRHLVIDSSDKAPAQIVRGICANYGAEYFWVPPKGVYPAMRSSLPLLGSDEYCMFLNSGDWLADRKALETIQTRLRESSPHGPAWLIGGISIVSGEEDYKNYVINSTEEDFGLQLRLGNIWLPHPSTVYQVSALKQVRPFADKLKIASDYATGLRMFSNFGSPVIEMSIISVFSAGGLSTLSPIRGQIENGAARIAAFGPSLLAREVFRLTRFLVWHYFQQPIRRLSSRSLEPGTKGDT